MILRRTSTVAPDTRRPSERPLPEAERRLRAAFPELWARYELLTARKDARPASKVRVTTIRS